VRTPSLLEEGLQLTGFLAASPPTYVRVVGNPNFQAERLIGYEAGYRVAMTSTFYVDLGAYHNHHDGLQSLGALSTAVEKTPPPPHILLVFPYANGVMGTSNGFEIAPDWQPLRAWQMRGSYSYLHLDLRNVPGNTDTSSVTSYEGSSPRHQAVVRSSLAMMKGWQLDQTLRYVSALPAQSVAAYLALDARIGWQATSDLIVAVTGQNLTDGGHQEFSHASAPTVGLKRSIYLTIRWSH
jgi:iron complex outermembrane receptor protein